MDPKERLDWYKGEESKQKLLASNAHLIPAAEHERNVAEVVKILIAWTEELPAVLERDCGLTLEQIEQARALVDRQCERIRKAGSPDA